MIEEKHIVKILECGYVAHDVRYFIVEKPENYKFTSGQATEISINKSGLEKMKREFTFTTLPDNPFLEFTIKMYLDHDKGMTRHLKDLKEGDELILHGIFGTINYKGPGIFIAGGAGVTPFISILRNLRKQGKLDGNKLILSNKTKGDIILEQEFRNMLGDNLILTLTREKKEGYENRKIDENFLKEKIKDFKTNFYICGPPIMVLELRILLEKLGAKISSITFEK